MESYRDAESHQSPMTSARDSLWKNIKAISGLLSYPRQSAQESIPRNVNNIGVPVSSTASVSNNNHQDDDYLAGSPVIIHGDDNSHHHHHLPMLSHDLSQNSNHNFSTNNRPQPYQGQEALPSIVVDREHESTLSEGEVRQIIEIYNKNIDDFTKENESLKDEINQLNSHLKEEEQRVYAVQQEISELKHHQVSSQADLEKVNMQVSLLKHFKETKDKFPFNEEIEIQKAKIELKEQFQINDDIGIGSLNDIEEQIKYMKLLEYQVMLLGVEKDFLENTDSTLNQLQDQTKWCINCKKDFKVSQNNDEACMYHSSRMKFYSCKGCGNVEYYPCCWRCNQCNPGCKTSKHISEAD